MTETTDLTPALLTHVTAVHRTARDWYPGYVDPDDLLSELTVYALENRRRFEKWTEKGEEYRVVLALRGAAKMYGATEKARASGYEYDDNAWYSPYGLAALMHLALDPGWDGLTGESDTPGGGGSAGGEGGTLLAMVVDVRRVVDRESFYGGFDPETELGMENLERLSELLGGPAPHAPGFRLARRGTS